VPSASTGAGYGVSSALSTEAASFAMGGLTHFRATQGTFGAGSTVTSQYGFEVASTLTGATNNFGFHSNIASGTGRWNFYAAGTATNFFQGNVGIGITAPAAKLSVAGAIRIGSSDTADYSEFGNNGTSNYWSSVSDPIEIFTGGATRISVGNTGVISLGAAPGAESLRVTPVASAVNYLNVQGSVTANTVGLFSPCVFQ
jgi:hypothetical protein